MVAMVGGRGAPFAAGPGFGRLGPPPFREASNREPADAVKVLLAAGADPNAKAPDGSTPLHQAVTARQVAIIRALAGAGAKLDAHQQRQPHAAAARREAASRRRRQRQQHRTRTRISRSAIRVRQVDRGRARADGSRARTIPTPVPPPAAEASKKADGKKADDGEKADEPQSEDKKADEKKSDEKKSDEKEGRTKRKSATRGAARTGRGRDEKSLLASAALVWPEPRWCWRSRGRRAPQQPRRRRPLSCGGHLQRRRRQPAGKFRRGGRGAEISRLVEQVLRRLSQQPHQVAGRAIR